MSNGSEIYITECVNNGILRVDGDGNIWRLKTRTRTGRLRDIHPIRADKKSVCGYRFVRCGRKYRAYVHRIVWRINRGPIPEGKEINHLDGNKGNNKLSNLEVVSKGENIKHSYNYLDRWRPLGTRNNKAKLTEKQVLNGNLIKHKLKSY